MNTVGKTLVILNLLFALVTGGFLVVDFATRNNWKKGFEDLKRELEVARANNDTFDAIKARLATEVKKLETELLAEKQRYVQLEQDTKTKIDQEGARAVKAAIESGEYLQTKTLSAGEVTKLREENKDLQGQVKNRNQVIVVLEADKNKFLAEAQAAIQEKNAAQLRNESLLERLRELEVRLAKMQVAGTTAVASAPTVRDKNQPNPPSAFVKGIVEKVDGTDRSLLQLSIGTDVGVGVDNTLEVYRLFPRAEYLGMVRIVEASQHRSIGRLIRVDQSTPMAVVRPGDEVASKISPR